MQKKWFVLIFLIVFCASSASGVIFLRRAGNSCPSGTFEVGYDGDHDSGADYVCYESGTASEQASANTADVVNSSYVEFNAMDEHLRFTITSDISADIDSQGTIFFSWRQNTGASLGAAALVEITYSATEDIEISSNATWGVFCRHNGGAEDEYVVSGSLSAQTDYRCGYTWDASTNYHAVKCVTSGSVSWGSPDDEDNEPIDGFDDSGAVDPTTLSIGEYLAGGSHGGETYRVWDVFVTTGYKGTDPGSL